MQIANLHEGVQSCDTTLNVISYVVYIMYQSLIQAVKFTSVTSHLTGTLHIESLLTTAGLASMFLSVVCFAEICCTTSA